MKITGSVAVVTGGAQGIGKAICKALLQNKAKVYFLDLNLKEGKNVQKEFEDEFGQEMATFLECNVRHKERFAEILSKVVEENGHLDILCNNAGIGPSSNNVENMVCVNLVSVIEGILLAAKIMDKNNGGHGGCILNIASTAGLFYIPASNCAYLASKHGVVGFTRAYAKVAMKSGVRINCICPSFVDTDMSRTSALMIPEVKQLQDTLGVQTVDDVARGFIRLLSDEDKFGEAMKISFRNGIEYHTFPPDPTSL